MAFEAKDYSISDILNKSVFDIPRNQRRYVWKKEHWRDLYEDIVFALSNRTKLLLNFTQPIYVFKTREHISNIQKKLSLVTKTSF